MPVHYMASITSNIKDQAELKHSKHQKAATQHLCLKDAIFTSLHCKVRQIIYTAVLFHIKWWVQPSRVWNNWNGLMDETIYNVLDDDDDDVNF